VLEVIGAGFGRTGTTSLKVALERLGFGPCYHMFEIIGDPAQVPRWQPVVRGERFDWAEVFDGYRSTVDWPGAAYWRELAEHYPHAKVLLSVRDPEPWYTSMHDTIYQFSLTEYVDDGSPEARHGIAMREIPERTVWDLGFGNRFADKRYAIETFERHNAEVQRVIPADRLLVYRLGDGWGPLCEFLGVEVPAEEFPHLNDTATMRLMADRARAGEPTVTPISRE
jgi:hypothetical protein